MASSPILLFYSRGRHAADRLLDEGVSPASLLMQISAPTQFFLPAAHAAHPQQTTRSVPAPGVPAIGRQKTIECLWYLLNQYRWLSLVSSGRKLSIPFGCGRAQRGRAGPSVTSVVPERFPIGRSERDAIRAVRCGRLRRSAIPNPQSAIRNERPPPAGLLSHPSHLSHRPLRRHAQGQKASMQKGPFASPEL
jgi:hypothetical protein